MKRVAILLAGLTLGTTSPAVAAAWAPDLAPAAAVQGLKLAQNDDGRDRRGPGNRDREEHGGARDPRDGRGQREPAPQRPPLQREAPPRDPRDSYDRREARPIEPRDPREVSGRGEAREPPQAYAAPRLSEQSAIGAVSRQFPGGRLLDSMPVMRNGRPGYSVRWLTRNGERVDVTVDGISGAVSRGGG